MSKIGSYCRIWSRIAAEPAPYSRIRSRRGAKPASYSRIRSRMASESASYSKMQQNARKIKEIRGSEKVGQGWTRGGPAEPAVAAYFASRKQIRISELGYVSAHSSNTAEPEQGAGRIEPTERYTASPNFGIGRA